MPKHSTITQLGLLVKAFREAAGLTQKELVQSTSTTTNRSVISYLESGARLPTPIVLRDICTFLEIPESLWFPFTLHGLRRRINKMSNLSEPIVGPRLIAVSGIMGSGKTTLARRLASAFGYEYVGEKPSATQYLPDLSMDPDRWAFETQLAFLLNKATSVLKALDSQVGVVMDRSLEEDVNIFARSFAEAGVMDNRSFETYSVLANYFLEELPDPDILIFCGCSQKTVLERIALRGRPDTSLHTPEHVSNIADYYAAWFKDCSAGMVVQIDSELWDWRESQVVQQIASEIASKYDLQFTDNHQPDLFDPTIAELNSNNTNGESPNQIVNVIRKGDLIARNVSAAALSLSQQPFPTAYIAAPFTSVAGPAGKSIGLFPERNPHGMIGKGGLRQVLLDLEKILQGIEISSLIPHRDVNNWGTKQLQPLEVAKLCTSHVTQCDLFIGIIGSSHGSHYEYGLARGLGKPSIIIHCSELKESFIASGLESDEHTMLSISCQRISDIPGRFGQSDVRAFVSRFV